MTFLMPRFSWNRHWSVAQWSKVFCSESKACFWFGKQGSRVWRNSGEAQNQRCLKSRVTFPMSEMIWSVMSLGFLKTTVIAAILQTILEHFVILTNPITMLNSLSSRHCQRYQELVQWPWCYCTVLDWPETNLTRTPQRSYRWWRGWWDTIPTWSCALWTLEDQ